MTFALQSVGRYQLPSYAFCKQAAIKTVTALTRSHKASFSTEIRDRAWEAVAPYFGASLYIGDFRWALERIRPHVEKTPLTRYESLETALNRQNSCRIFLKLENEQPTNSFKVRGAFNALLTLPLEQSVNGIVTCSNGNFASAIAYAGSALGIKPRVVMSMNAPEIKKIAAQRFGAEVTLVGATQKEADLAIKKIQYATRATFISAYNHPDIIKGQGTIALEVFDELPTIRHFFAPIGRGGLLSGCAAALKLLNPAIQIAGIEPEGASDYCLSRFHGRILPLRSIHTICDELRADQVSALARPILDCHVNVVYTVCELSVMKAMKWLNDHCNLKVEPSGATALAGLMQYNGPLQGDIVCAVTGSNVDAHEEYISRYENS